MSDAHSAIEGTAFGPTYPHPRKDVVLLLEDNETIAKMLMAVLRQIGLRVVWSPLGAEGMAAFRRHDREVALVLADCRLPDMDGREVCQQMRELVPTLPVLVTSGSVTARNLGPLVPHRLVQYLPKPYAPSEIISRVRQLLAQAEQAESAAAGFV
ncbi:MAG: response regulator [Opitutae bacterium]|nr:response regulator [Opitutae bacterium]